MKVKLSIFAFGLSSTKQGKKVIDINQIRRNEVYVLKFTEKTLQKALEEITMKKIIGLVVFLAMLFPFLAWAQESDIYNNLYTNNLVSDSITGFSLNTSKERVKFLKAEAKKGSGTAYFLLGDIYNYPFYDYYNRKKAFKYYQKAVSYGEIKAYQRLGGYYQQNKPPDYDQAEKYYLLAIDNGYTFALLNLAFLYMETNWKKYSFAKANDLLDDLLACSNPPTEAMIAKAKNLINGFGTVQDPQAAIALLEEAIEKNHPAAPIYLGTIYLDGKYVTKDKNKAYELFQNAYEGKSIGNRMDVAYYLMTSNNAEAKNIGFNYLKELAEIDKYPLAQFYLAQSYNIGVGTDKNLVEAAAWYITSYYGKLPDNYSMYAYGNYKSLFNGLNIDQRKELLAKRKEYIKQYVKK